MLARKRSEIYRNHKFFDENKAILANVVHERQERLQKKWDKEVAREKKQHLQEFEARRDKEKLAKLVLAIDDDCTAALLQQTIATCVPKE